MKDQKLNNMQSQPGENNPQGIEEQKIAENPNPRANENIPNSDSDAGPDTSNEQEVGSEITDGEDA